ncbi:MAG: ComEA family DNA-binding protein [Candidatus Rifleibacteriota bacterium]
MPELTNKIINQSRLLIAAVLLCAFIWQFSLKDPRLIYPDQAVPEGELLVEISSSDSDTVIENVSQNGPPEPNHIDINTANYEQLLLCPGIGPKTAEKILLERSYGKFVDWRSLKDRVKGISDKKISNLKSNGVKLN